MRTKVIIMFLLVALAAVLPTGARAVKCDYYFNHHDIREGLSQNTVTSILQDSYGFMWFGTQDGLNRYDGINFRRVVPAGNPRGCNFVSDIYEASDGRLWIGANDGIYVYDPTLERLERLDARTFDGHPITGYVSLITTDPQGRIVVSSDNDGVYRFDSEKGRFELLRKENDMSVGKVNALVYDSNGRMWIGLFGSGLFYSDDNMQTLHRVHDGVDRPYLARAIVNDLAVVGGNLYVSTDASGFHRVSLLTLRGEQVFREVDGTVPYLRKIMACDSGIWLGSESGVYIYDIGRNKVVEHLTHDSYDRYSISDNAIYSLYTDRDGGIWLGSYFGGVDYMSAERLNFRKFYRGRSGAGELGERVRELCQSPDGSIYVGTEDAGLCRLDTRSGRFEPVVGLGANNVHGLAFDGDRLWVGTFSKGLKTIDVESGRIKHYYTGPENGLISDYVFSILRTVGGEIYVGTLSGLERYDRSSDTFEPIMELRNIFVYDILEDSGGNLWAATYSQGLYMRRAIDGKWCSFACDADNSGSLPDNKTYGIYEDSGKNIWVMTQSGVAVYDRKSNTFNRTYMGVDRLQGVVYQVIEDDFGRFWLTTNHGLYCIDGKSMKMSRFSISDGLPTNQFNYSSSLKTANGEIWLGTIDGLVCFDPRRYDFTPHSWRPFISRMWLHGEEVLPGTEGSPLEKSIFMTEELKLESDQNSLSFRVVNLCYDCPPDQPMKYKLDGFEDDWHYTTLSDGMISYWNLPSGNYRLLVAPDGGAEHDGSGDGVLALRLSIATPFYKSVWAIAVYILLAGLLVTTAIRIYLKNKRKGYRRLMEDYSREKEREAYDSKIRFFTNVAHEIRTPLTLIKAPIDTLMRSSVLKEDPQARDDLDVINLNVDRLLVLANQLLDFRKMESGKFQIHKERCDIKTIIEVLIVRFRPTIDENSRQLIVDMPEGPVEATVDPEAVTKILSNLFTNAIKYGSSYIKLHLETGNGNVILRMANDGDVVSPEKRETIFAQFSRLENNQGVPGIGIGLAYARSLAMMHDGSLVMAEDDSENIFVLTLPADSTADIGADDESDLEYMIKRNEDSVTVLIVEDNAEMIGFLERRLIGHNYKVIKASDGQEALDILADSYVDIIVSDLMMPRIDGLELLRHVKGDINFSHIPFVLLTARTRMEDKLSGLEAGADAYIEKPFSIEYLLANLSTLLRNRERMRRRIENQPIGAAPGKGLTKVDEEFLRKINDTIRANFDNPDFAMDELISALGVSRTTFYRKIKGLLNLNPNDYIKLERLKQAAKLFGDGHSSVSEVCYMVGFSSPGYFTKCFQKQFGVSPKEYIAGKRAQ
ncbi:MAG: response regulator [Muribaculaceae bacterium]|nr:response regulator [Muribaculaceae bacterium]